MNSFKNDLRGEKYSNYIYFNVTFTYFNSITRCISEEFEDYICEAFSKLEWCAWKRSA